MPTLNTVLENKKMFVPVNFQGDWMSLAAVAISDKQPKGSLEIVGYELAFRDQILHLAENYSLENLEEEFSRSLERDGLEAYGKDKKELVQMFYSHYDQTSWPLNKVDWDNPKNQNPTPEKIQREAREQLQDLMLKTFLDETVMSLHDLL